MACEYCKDGKIKEIHPNVYDGELGYIVVYVERKFRILTLQHGEFCAHYSINHCPMCGERLGDADERA